MQIFANEKSAHEQCVERIQVNLIVGAFTSILQRIARYRTTNSGWCGPRIDVFQNADLRAECVLLLGGLKGTLLGSVSDSLVRAQFIGAIQQLGIRNWSDSRIQDDDVLYILWNEPLDHSSIAELVERKSRNSELLALLINFGLSRFAGLDTIEVIREDNSGATITITVPMIENVVGLESLAADWKLIPLPYSQDSSFAPRDDQTVLVDKNRFQRTPLSRKQGRTVYLERATGHYWYVDNMHFGMSAEIEVFDASGNHYGTATLNGEVNTGNRVLGRTIEL